VMPEHAQHDLGVSSPPQKVIVFADTRTICLIVDFWTAGQEMTRVLVPETRRTGVAGQGLSGTARRRRPSKAPRTMPAVCPGAVTLRRTVLSSCPARVRRRHRSAGWEW